MIKKLCGIMAVVGVAAAILFIMSPHLAAYDHALGNIKYNVVVEGSRTWTGGERIATGSGVLISEDGLVLTARHVVQYATSVRVTLPDGRVFDVNDWYKDPKNDVAVIDLPVEVNEYIVLSDSNEVKSGDKIYSIGNDYGIWDDAITFGEVHRIGFKRLMLGRDCEFIFAKMDVISGTSGGGVYEQDKLIGIVVMKSHNATFIVPSNVCKKTVEDYRCQPSQKLNIDSCGEWLQGIFPFLE